MSNKRGPRPLTNEWMAWYANIASLRATIDKVRSRPSPHGVKWKHGMLEYYEGKLNEAIKTEPPKYQT